MAITMKTQKIELIPVVEIFISNPKVDFPEHGPSWEYASEWHEYNEKCLELAGFSKNLKSYFKATSFYEVNKITTADLVQLIELEIQKQQSDEEKGVDDLACAFDGGYVLKVNDENILYPQCCSDLSDIQTWKDLLDKDSSFFYSGHPSPRITKTENELFFDFVNTETTEKFAPPVPYETIKIEKNSLASAIKNAEKELELFSKKLQTVNIENKMGIKNIVEVLIYGT